jgi:cell division protease FtsH
MNANLRNFALWVIIVLLLLVLFMVFRHPAKDASVRPVGAVLLFNRPAAAAASS